MRYAVPQGHLGEKQQEKSSLALYQPLGIRHEILQGIPTIEESRLHQAIVSALNRLDEDKADVIETLKAGLRLAIGSQDDDSFNEAAVQNRITELQSVMMDLVELSSKSSTGADYFDAKFEEIAAEIKGLQGQLGEHQEQTKLAQNTQARIHELLYMMEHTDLSLKEYREDVVKGDHYPGDGFIR